MRYPKWVASAAIVVGLSFPAFALDDTAKSAAQNIIRHQAESLEKDDAETAFSFAAPNIQMMMGDSAHFLAMVQRGYAPVYRHRSFDFGDAEGGAGIMIQRVRIVDAQGLPWDAIYTLMQMPDGSWKIHGCILTQVGQDA